MLTGFDVPLGQFTKPGGRSRLVATMFGGLFLGLSACGPSNAETSSAEQPSAPRPKQVYAVAGITAGMTADRVKLVAERSGFEIWEESKGPDWQRVLDITANGPGSVIGKPLRGISKIVFYKGSERISVDFLPSPQGSIAYGMYYSAPKAVVSFDQAVAELTKRFGSATVKKSTEPRAAVWCAGPARTPEDCYKQAYMAVTQGGRDITISFNDRDLLKAQELTLSKQNKRRPSF